MLAPKTLAKVAEDEGPNLPFPLTPAEGFYLQGQPRKEPVRYHSYRDGSGRDAYIEETWGAGALERAQRHE